MSWKKSILVPTLIIVSMLLCGGLLFLSFPTEQDVAFADNPVTRSYAQASSADIIQCIDTDSGEYCENTTARAREKDLFKKIPNGQSLCSYTSARFTTTHSSNNSGNNKVFDYCFYDPSTSKFSLLQTTSEDFFFGTDFFATTYNTGHQQIEDNCAMTADADEKYLFFNGDPLGMYLHATFNLSQEIIDALADRLLNVTVTPYVITVDKGQSSTLDGMIYDNDNDTIFARCFIYNNGAIQAGSAKSLSVHNGDVMLQGTPCNVTHGTYTRGGSNASFFQVSLYNYSNTSGCSAAIAEVGIKVTVTPNTGLIFETPSAGGSSTRKTSTYTITGTDRNDKEKPSMELSYASVNSSVNFDMVIAGSGSTVVYLDAAEANAAHVGQSGLIFQKIFNPFTKVTGVASGEDIPFQRSSVIAGQSVASNTYYERSYNSVQERYVYTVTSDTTFSANKEYYKHQYYEKSGDTFVPTQDSIYNSDKTYYYKPFIVEYYLPDYESGSMDVDQSSSETGQKASIIVLGGNSADLLIIRIAIRYRDLIATGGDYKIVTSQDVKIYVDKQAPAAPAVASNSFFHTYLSETGMLSFYTASDDAALNRDATGNVKSLNLGAVEGDANKIQFTDSSLDITTIVSGNKTSVISETGGSDLTIYYKATYFGESYPSSPGDKSSDGISIDVNNANLQDPSKRYIYTAPSAPSGNVKNEGSYIGIYCETKGESVQVTNNNETYFVKYVTVEYGDLFLDMTYYNETLGKIDYRQKGVWQIEFFVYDTVGNYNYTSVKSFIKVDITEYTFTINYYVGDLKSNLDSIGNDKVKLYYEKIAISGELAGRGKFNTEIREGDGNNGELVLFRGDRVCFLVKFEKTSYYNEYILTSFQIGGGAKQDCTGFVFTDNKAVLGMTNARIKTNSGGETWTAYYTFEVSESLCKDVYDSQGNLKNNKVINFYFKKRIAISAANLNQAYNGVSKKIIPYATYTKDNTTERLTNLNIMTTYYSLIPADGSRYVPQSEGYEGDIIQGNVYRPKNNNTIVTSINDEEFVLASGRYQAGVSYYEKVSVGNSNSNYPLHKGTYYCVCTVKNHDTYYGLSVIVFNITAGTPDLSGLYGLAGNNKGQRLEIDYGVSLETIDWVWRKEGGEYVVNNRINTETGFETFNTNFYVFFEDKDAGKTATTYALDKNGVLGYFELAFSDAEKLTDNYIKPSAGLRTIRVRFVPIMTVEDSNAYEWDSLGGLSYNPAYSDGKFIRNVDYNVREVDVWLYVKPCTLVNFELDGSQLVERTDAYEKVIFTYTGATLPVKYSVTSAYENEDGSFISGNSAVDPMKLGSSIRYAAISAIGDDLDQVAFSSSVPIRAGLYAVRVTVSSDSNYTGQIIWYEQIMKVNLSVTVESETKDFQYEIIPAVTIKKSGTEISGIEWTYSFYHYDVSRGLTYAETCSDAYRVADEDLRAYTGTPYNAGTYVIKVDITDNDYSGTGYALYTIQKVNNSTPSVVFSWPSLNESTLMPGCHICYGQPLSEARLTGGNSYYVRYGYVDYVSGRSVVSVNNVPGSFYVVSKTYAAWLDQDKNKAAPSDSNRAEYISTMKMLSTEATNYDGYAWKICFQADDKTNFDFLYTDVNFVIGRAALNWDHVTIDPITYGTLVRYDGNHPENSTINIARKVALVYSQNGTRPIGVSASDYFVVDNYVYLYIDPALYTMQLQTTVSDVPYEVGTEYLTVRFAPASATNKNFGAEDNNCMLIVNKKTLTIGLSNEDGQNGTVSMQSGTLQTYYGYYIPSDTMKFFRYSGNTAALPILNGVFYYSKSGVDYVLNGRQYVVTYQREVTADQVRSVWTIQEEIRDAGGNVLYDALGMPRTEIKRREMLYSDVGKSFTVVEYVAELPAGTYGVRCLIDNKNYYGEVTYDLTIKKAPLTASVDPLIENEKMTLCYNLPIANLNFYGGEIVALYSGEAVPGRYIVNSSSYEQERFGNYNTDIEVRYVYIPSDTDNYETYYGSLGTKKVNKQDVSSSMDLQVGTYVYSHGHNKEAKQYGALTNKFFRSSYVPEEGSSDTYEEFIKKNLDHSFIVPENLQNKYYVEVFGYTDGTYVNAGTYTVTLFINNDDDLNYCGSATTTLTVKRDSAYIVLLRGTAGENETYYTDYIVNKTFNVNGMPQGVTPLLKDSTGANVTGVGVTTTYYHNGLSINTPGTIGRYEVRMSLNTKLNYMLVTATYSGDPTEPWQLGSSEITNVMASLSIGVNTSEIRFRNITQTYSEPQTVSVNLGANNAYCSLEYVRLTPSGEETGPRFTDTFPTEAGEYNIHLMFGADLNEGYEDDIVWSVPLTIEKYEASIVCPDLVETTYTGRQNDIMVVYTEPYGLRLLYSYGEDVDHLTPISSLGALGALHAASYKVCIEIENDNYCGRKIIDLKIGKASLRVSEAPAFASYVYHSETLPEAQPDKGKVYCPDKIDAVIGGTFALSYEEISVLSVGNPSVTYTFTPDPIEVDGVMYYDFAPVTGKVRLTIQKAPYDMSLVTLVYKSSTGLLEESDFTVEYNGDRYELSAKFEVSNDTTAYIYNYSVANADFRIAVSHYLNGSIISPSDIGTYTVRATVVSQNYSGTKDWTHNLVIERGEPVISVFPTIGRSIKINDSSPLTSSDFIGGSAHVNGYPDKEITGNFSVATTSFTKANKNDVSVTFTPFETRLYKPVTFLYTVNVVGKDAFSMTTVSDEETLSEKSIGETINNTDWTSSIARVGMACSRIIYPASTIIANINTSHTHGAYICIAPANGAESLYYGVTLDRFELSFKPCVEGCSECANACHSLEENGVLKFTVAVPSEYIPNVGEAVGVSYDLYSSTDTDWQKLNNMTGTISLGSILVKARIPASAEVELIGFWGEKLVDDYRLNIVTGGKTIDAQPTEVRFATDAGFALDTETLTMQQNGMTVRLESFVSCNYEFVTLPTLSLKVYNGLSNADIVVGKTSKVFDGRGISFADLSITVENTAVPLPESSFTLIITDENGNGRDGADIGTYTVLILLKDDTYHYYGEKQVSYVVQKRDVSEEISLTKTQDRYGSTTVSVDPNVLLTSGGETTVLPDSEVSIKYRLSGSGNNFTGSVSDAGLYDVRVIVTSENYYGEKVLSYRVLPKEMTIDNNRTYSFIYGNECTENREINIRFTDGSDMDKVVYFQKEGYSRTTTVPTDAGNYIVTVVLTDSNYTLTNPTFDYVIQPKTITLETEPTIQTQHTSDGSVYNIKYGTKLNALNTKFLGGKAVIETGDVIPGKFIVDPKDDDKILNAGTQTATIRFVPDSTNYSGVSFVMNVIVSRVELKVEFINLTTYYTGEGKTLSPEDYFISGASENVNVTILFVDAIIGTKYTRPVNAGTYELEVSSLNGNYVVTTTTVYGGEGAPVFTIKKASVNVSKTEMTKPVAVPVRVGQSLMQSSLNGGATYYNGFTNAVNGTYTFVQTAKSFKTAGTDIVEYRFTPIDSNNFDSYRSTVPITINKGKAEIRWHDVYVTYGTPADFSALRSAFTTSPNNLFYRVSTFDVRNNANYDDTGDEPLYMNANTYTFTCWIEDDNYESTVYQFNYVVQKKEIDIDFVNDKGIVVTAFNVLYARSVYYGFKLYDSNDTTGKRTYLARDAATIGTNVQYNFVSKEEGVTYEGRTPPTEMGSYTITATLIHDNYVATVSANYKIAKGTVEEIAFDIDSLSKQIYGSVSAPIVITVPTDVNYYIIYQGFDKTIPTDVGSYNITVYIDDLSFNSKQMSAVFKINPKPLVVSSYEVTDKVYDGTTTIAVTGKLTGILFSDEVTLTMRGATADDSAEPGKHGVKITSYNLAGLRAGNYVLTVPDCTETVTIKASTVRATGSRSYMTSSEGFEEGTGITFYEVNSSQNQTSTTSKAVGASSTIIGYTVSVNGESTITTGQYKICVEIPEEYRDTDFTVDFNGQTVLDPHREGDMYVFNTSVSSGQIVFSRSSFKYTYAIIIAAVAIVLIGVILILILNPMKKNK